MLGTIIPFQLVGLGSFFGSQVCIAFPECPPVSPAIRCVEVGPAAGPNPGEHQIGQPLVSGSKLNAITQSLIRPQSRFGISTSPICEVVLDAAFAPIRFVDL